MPAYWWKCSCCKKTFTFPEITNSSGLPQFIQKELVQAEWDQSLLIKRCPSCQKEKLAITYEFPRKNDHMEITLLHAVGLSSDSDYIPMMWETISSSEPDKSLFDFKYIRGNNPNGLNKPAVFSRRNLAEIFSFYCKIVGEKTFP